MRSAQYVFAAVLTFTLAGTAAAQTTSPSPATTQATYAGATVSHWLASGFVGGGFDANGDSPNIDSNSGSVALGGQVGYLWHGIVGPEFLFEWAPNFNAFESSLISSDTNMTSYMANAIATYPLGADGQFLPFASGGYGRIRASADVEGIGGNTASASNGEWGWNVGGGLMAFASSRWGVRGDVRWYKANTDDNFNGTPGENLIQGLISGLSYWRATGGVSFRW
jgi:Outer membrane protein beta-barrel domain